MWSDRLPPHRRLSLADQIREVVPPDSLAAWPHTPNPPAPSHPGFAWLKGIPLSPPLATAAYSHGRGVIAGPQGTTELSAPGFDILEAMFAAWQGTPALLAGFLSYDLAAELEDLGASPPGTFRFPQFHFGLYRRLEAQDEPAKICEEPISSRCRLTSRPDRTGFEAAVERIVQAIQAGDFFQTNLCRSIETCLEPGSEWNLFHCLRKISPARYEAFLRIDQGRAVLSISPEMFLKVQNGIVESAPIKGTRPRGSGGDEDLALQRELAASEKDRAELAMIVDVTRNDLGRVCQTGSVEVIQHAGLMTLPTVHHLFSKVKGTLREDAGPVDLLRAAFPAASITGAPKIEAMRAALREERQWRGPCMGAIGWISLNGPGGRPANFSAELSVAIRTAFACDGRLRYYAGCGITADSVPQAEFAESRHKASAFARALGRERDSDW